MKRNNGIRARSVDDMAVILFAIFVVSCIAIYAFIDYLENQGPKSFPEERSSDVFPEW